MKSLPIGKSALVAKLDEPKIQPKKQEKLTQPQTESLSRLAESGFSAGLLRESLVQKLGALAGAKLEATTKPPIDYFEIDKSADELIKKHTKDGFFGDSLKTDDLGRELADIAKTDPDRAAALTDNILDKIDGGDKDELAQSFVESMSPEELREFAATDRGRELLGKLRHHLDEGITWGDERDAMRRIDNAIKAADLEKSAEFKKLSPETQREILSRLDANQGSDKATDNLIKLVKSSEFAALPAATQREILNASDKHKDDKVFIDGLIATAGKTDFKNLTEAQQKQVLGDFVRIADSDSYDDAGSDSNKAFLLDNLGNTSILSASEPGNTAVRNTLDKILNNEVTIELYSEASKNGRITFGTNNGNGELRINTHPDANNDAAYGKNNFTDTIVHELNHQLNQGAEHGTPEQFLNEYRAFYVGIDAVDPTPDAATQRDIIDNLINGYPKIKELYDNNADFKKFIDDALAGLNETPPKLLDPEQMRQALVDAGFKDDYLQKTGNIDNH